MAKRCSRERPKADGAFLSLEHADSDVGTRWVPFGFVAFERRVSIVISASQWDET